MKIIVDGFGGDNAPTEIIKGCAMAVKELNVNIILTGNKNLINQEASKYNINLKNIEIMDCKSVMPVEEDPTEILKKYSDSSMAVGLSLLSKEDGSSGDAFVSAGSTGALVVGASLIVKRIKGIKRAAIATLVPTIKGCYMLIDSGANHDCRPEMLVQFGLMGSIYMNKIEKLNSPKVAILNIGIEKNKGTDLQKNAYELLKKLNLNFIGNIEARDIPFGLADVVISDGFVGNILLKYTEGLAKFFVIMIKNIFLKNIFTKCAAILVKGGMKNFKKKLDYTEFGGAILLGIKRPVIKAHGSSNAKAIKNAIRQAYKMVKNNTINTIDKDLKEYSQNLVDNSA